MKKTLLLIAMVVTSYNVFAFTTMGAWRWRKDDGSETTATWRADQNTPITIASFDSTLRLRIELYNDKGGLLDGALFEYTTDTTSGIWDTIKINTLDKAFVLAGSSPNVTDLQPTTQQLNGQVTPYVFTPGKIIVATNKLPNYTLGTNQTTEYEWVFKPAAGIQTNTTYYFRVDATDNVEKYDYPSLTTAGVLPVNIASFKVEADQNRTLIKWTTAKEENNSHFDIERSTDSKNYAVIATVKGNGTSSLSHNYQAVDNAPADGMNYYRIKQYDVDGKYQISDIRALQFVLKNTLVNVFPNPSKGDVNFAVQNYKGTSLQAALYNVSGRLVHQEAITTNTTGSYKLHLAAKLPAGVYMLKLEGSSLSEKLKIVIQ